MQPPKHGVVLALKPTDLAVAITFLELQALQVDPLHTLSSGFGPKKAASACEEDSRIRSVVSRIFNESRRRRILVDLARVLREKLHVNTVL